MIPRSLTNSSRFSKSSESDACTFSSKKYNEDSQILSPTDLFSIIMAATCHDFNHSGVDNPFCIATQNKASLLYLDTGAMESAHASLSWG